MCEAVRNGSRDKAGRCALNEDEVILAWHSQAFRLRCAELDGKEFQSFFEAVMEKVDSSFVKIKPSGREGDWKSDGWLPGPGICFQVYAPEALKVAETVAKVKSDFAGALSKWKDALKSWIFVWSAQEKGLPAAILDTLNGLSGENPKIGIDQWGRERLWEKVKVLSREDRVDLLGVVPLPDQITSTTDHEVQVLLTFIAEQPVPDLDDDLELVELEDKMDRNDLNDEARLLIRSAMAIVPTVAHYVSNNPDPRFSQRVAIALGDRYEKLYAAMAGDPNAVFASLIDRVANGAPPGSKRRWAAVAIVAHYFELCDIFER
jgi:hypothetical protein